MKQMLFNIIAINDCMRTSVNILVTPCYHDYPRRFPFLKLNHVQLKVIYVAE